MKNMTTPDKIEALIKEAKEQGECPEIVFEALICYAIAIAQIAVPSTQDFKEVVLSKVHSLLEETNA